MLFESNLVSKDWVVDSGLISVFGGTFDPIHFGLLRAVLSVKDQLMLPNISIIPSNIPPHRPSPIAEAKHRVSMVRLAVNSLSDISCDDREIRRGGVSYTILTVTELRKELGATPLCLIVGLDSFLDLPHWYRWEEILDNAHIIVMKRPGWNLPSSRPLWWLNAAQDTAEVLYSQPAGGVFCVSVPPIDLTSTKIRSQLASVTDPGNSLPKSVFDYIKANHLYG